MPASTTAGWAGPCLAGTTATGWSDRAVRGASCAGSPTPWVPSTATGANLPDPLLLVPAFQGVERVSARVSATRRDRLTARLPMLWPTDPEGGAGAVRGEVRGDRDAARAVEVLGALDWPAVAAGGVAAVAVLAAARGTIGRVGAFGLADAAVPTGALLADLADRGVNPWFTGFPTEGCLSRGRL